MTTQFSLRAVFAAAIAALSCGLAAAADNKTIDVSATVSGTCKLTTVQDMSFTLDPSGSTAGSATATLKYKCTKGTAPVSFAVAGDSDGSYTSGTTAATGALVRQAAGNTDVLQFSITWTPPTGQGSGFGTGSTETDIALTGAIALTQFQNAKADTYKKTITVDISN